MMAVIVCSNLAHWADGPLALCLKTACKLVQRVPLMTNHNVIIRPTTLLPRASTPTPETPSVRRGARCVRAACAREWTLNRRAICRRSALSTVGGDQGTMQTPENRQDDDKKPGGVSPAPAAVNSQRFGLEALSAPYLTAGSQLTAFGAAYQSALAAAAAAGSPPAPQNGKLTSPKLSSAGWPQPSIDGQMGKPAPQSGAPQVQPGGQSAAAPSVQQPGKGPHSLLSSRVAAVIRERASEGPCKLAMPACLVRWPHACGRVCGYGWSRFVRTRRRQA